MHIADDSSRIYLDSLSKTMEGAYKNIMGDKRRSLAVTASKLDALSPLGALSRGFSLTKDESGAVVKSVKRLNKGDKISVTLSDGTARATVDNIEFEENHG